MLRSNLFILLLYVTGFLSLIVFSELSVIAWIHMILPFYAKLKRRFFYYKNVKGEMFLILKLKQAGN